jgi:hypothetical protein
MVTYSKASSIKELHQILALQKKNLPENLSEEEKREQGFVTVKHSLEILTKMNNECPHSIVKNNDKVIGYALSMTKSFALDITALKPMFLEISKVVSDEKYIIMGQVCIDKEFRAKGIFKNLYEFMKISISLHEFDSIITEIDTKNERSLKAHKSIGFKKLLDYKHNNKHWRIVSLKT